MRAALALGYFDYTKGRYAEATKWLDRAQHDPLLAEYSAYWTAEVDLAQNRDPQALQELKEFRKNFPESAITEQVLQALGEAALASNNRGSGGGAELVFAGDRAPRAAFPAGRGLRTSRPTPEAAADYQAVYMRFAASDQSRQAATRLDFLRAAWEQNFPPFPWTSKWRMRQSCTTPKTGVTRAANIPLFSRNFRARITTAPRSESWSAA